MTRRQLRSGFTTGACAAAASLGAALLLRDGELLESVELPLPAGFSARFVLHGQEQDGRSSRCFVVKDAGDDPDVTHGVELHAELSWVESAERELQLLAGTGIGRVTKPGLAVAVGEPAINPVPRQMISQAVASVFPELPAGQGLQLCLSVPDGEARAEKTLNRRLGILGGLSLLGTTGVVRPISHKAWTDTLEVALDVALAAGSGPVVLSTGRTSEWAAQRQLQLAEEAFVMMGDHIGYTLQACHRKGLPAVVLSAQFAKLVKIACGHPQTHVRNSQLDLGQLQLWGREIDLDPGELQQLELAHTAREIFERCGADAPLIRKVADQALAVCRDYLPGARLQILLVDYRGRVAGVFSMP